MISNGLRYLTSIMEFWGKESTIKHSVKTLTGGKNGDGRVYKWDINGDCKRNQLSDLQELQIPVRMTTLISERP